MTIATPAHVGVEIGRPLTDAETAQATQWLEVVEAMLSGRIPDLHPQVAAGAILEALVVQVEAAAVVRKLRNPDGLRSWSATVDDSTVQQTTASAAADGTLRILPDEWALLIPDSGGAFSVRPSYAPSVAIPDRGVFDAR